MKPLSFLCALVAFAFLFPLAAALSTAYVPAVDAQGGGLVTTFEARAVNGTGEIFVSIDPIVSVDTQHSERLAVKVAAEEAGVDQKKYDMLFKIFSNAEIVDGPSAGAVLTMLSYAEFTHQELRSDIAITGTIEPGGRIGQVGGVFEKTGAVAKFDGGKIKVFFVPEGQGIQNGVDLSAYAKAKWGLQVVEVSDAHELTQYVFTAEGSEVAPKKRASVPLNPVRLFPSPELAPFLELAGEQVEFIQGTLAKRVTPKLFGNRTGEIIDAANLSLVLSQQLLEKGYYYSFANNAFILSISLDQIILANSTRSEFNSLLGRIRNTSSGREFPMPTTDNLEWFVGAKLRHYWAQDKLSEIDEASPGAPVEALVGDYAAANNWLQASGRLGAIATEHSTGKTLNQLAFRDLASAYLKQATDLDEKGLLDTEGFSHLETARRAFADADYLSAAFDAAFPIAYSRALDKTDGKLLSDVYSDACGVSSEAPFESVSAVSSEATEKPCKAFARVGAFKSVWAQLYYAHGLYSLQEANRSRDFDSAVNAVKLFELSSELDGLVERIQKTAANSPGATTANAGQQPSPTSATGNSPSGAGLNIEVTQTPSNSLRDYVIYGSAALVALFVILLIVLSRHPSGLRDARSLEYAQRLDNLEKMLLDGRLSEETYYALKSKYGARLGRSGATNALLKAHKKKLVGKARTRRKKARK